MTGRKRPASSIAVPASFKFNLELGARAGAGVIVASIFQTAYTGPANGDAAYPQLYYFFPSWYILGGVSYIAIAMIFSLGTNVGSTIRETFQETLGVVIAFVFNIVVFACFTPRVYHSADDVANSLVDGTLVRIEHAFNGIPYYVTPADFYTMLPCIILFTIAIVMTPLETITKKLAVGNNIYFALTLINPNNPNDNAHLKPYNDPMLATSNIFRNLFVYLLLGVLGGLIALVVMLLPYPIFAIRRLRAEIQSATTVLAELLHLMVDAYCFRRQTSQHTTRVAFEVSRRLADAEAKQARMEALLDDVWWEQSVGLHFLFPIRTSIIKPFLGLYANLLDDLRAMSDAVQNGRHGTFHSLVVSHVPKDVYLVQTKSVRALDAIASDILGNARVLSTDAVDEVRTAMTALLQAAHAAHVECCEAATSSDIEDAMTCYLFLFALESYCETLCTFPRAFNQLQHNTGLRAWKFLQRWCRRMLDPTQYTKQNFQIGIKVACAVVSGSVFAVYVFGFSPTAASALAYLWGSHVGGSFSRTANRVGGAVAGSIVPSVCLFLICSYGCTSSTTATILLDSVMFVWVTMSMYISLQNHAWSYAGFVSAYVSSGVFLNGCSCGATIVAPISSYANLAQVSLGIVFFILIEWLLFPQSATALLRSNILTQLQLLQTAFHTLFEGTVAANGDVPTLVTIEEIVMKTLPSLLLATPGLLTEAQYEPRLWRPPFPITKFAAVCDGVKRLQHHTRVMFKLAKWFQRRRHSVQRRLSVDASDLRRRSTVMQRASAPPTMAWTFSTTELGAAIHDTFASLETVFGDAFALADADRVAHFLQMKEAFRRADVDGNGVLDVAEVERVLRALWGHDAVQLDDLVRSFMALVDKDKSGAVSCQEFMDAIDDGLVLRGPSRPSLHPQELVDLDDVALTDTAQSMRTAYTAWLLQDRRFEMVSMDELLLLNGLMGCVSGIAVELQRLADVSAQ
ncbi:hypothetical protein SPRG_00255 [Saprolegnia parasitica CBS 223.65]|uniref:EF-hand domain-containing protein n=1 Tax=Saprolegnia parasitica (strain CBS 223.65) TaxID=695850 RepID=A0A067D1M4_SAPPC|nr:hypothetical protein SPRG_00255 [Saprolegnia parasitica CBS 223.65]KDO35405.1 hypothetical protein SPRG_00255 [Saprolegnia parasitica CBS 223.65]|eukprot:XP_012193748.1 hypothetical protein SPRG_00255 [Saprolegnia parasitica CBS 223.65]